MKTKAELINVLKAELTLLAQDILKDIHKKDLKDLYKSSRKLYEKTNAVYQLSKLANVEEIGGVIADPSLKTMETIKVPEPETSAGQFFEKNENQEKPKENKQGKQENLSSNKIYKSVNNMKFVPKTAKKTPQKISNKEIKKMNIGLNDKIAFIRHLFNNDSTTYNKVIDRLNACESYEKALEYINKEVKPQYNNWQDKDEYEFRLIQLLELKFNK